MPAVIISPIPLEPPVTTATFPDILNKLVISICIPNKFETKLYCIFGNET